MKYSCEYKTMSDKYNLEEVSIWNESKKVLNIDDIFLCSFHIQAERNFCITFLSELEAGIALTF